MVTAIVHLTYHQRAAVWARAAHGGHWTGIGFSHDGAMAKADAIIVTLASDGETVSVIDHYSPGYGRPVVDRMQDVFKIETAVKDGLVHANFSRSLNTGDAGEDVDLDGQCHHLLYLYPGGPVDPVSDDIGKHTQTPAVSDARVCIGQCGVTSPGWEEPTEEETTSKKAPETSSIRPATAILEPSIDSNRVDEPQVKLSGVPPMRIMHHQSYDIAIRLPAENWTSPLADSNSSEFRQLADMIHAVLDPFMASKWPARYKALRVVKFMEGGSVLSLLQVQFEGMEEPPSADEVRDYLRQVASTKQVSNDISIDPEAMQVQESRDPDVIDNWAPLRDLRNWSIAAGVILILASVLICLCLCSLRRRRKDTTHPALSKHSIQTAPIYHYGMHGQQPLYSSSTMFSGAYGAATTASVKDSPASPKIRKKASKKERNGESPPHGMGETTYQEWFSKVASKESPTHFQESPGQYRVAGNQRGIGYNNVIMGQSAGGYYAGVPATPQQQAAQQCYVTYPGEGYYGTQQQAPPAYYRQY